MQTSYLGVYRALVTSTADPTGLNKVRTQCPQISGSAELRWAEPVNPEDDLPLPGTIVWVAFSGGDLTKPIYFTNNATNHFSGNIYLQGAAIKTNSTNTPYTWTVVSSFGTGWASGTGVGGSYPPLRWRYDAEDNVHVHGTLHATSTSPTSPIATGFPHCLINGTSVSPGGMLFGVNTNNVFGFYINNSGELRNSNMPTIAVNDTYHINAKVPIGSIA